MERIAVVIPLYNHEKFILEALESVEAQTRPVDQVIIVDDGSSDRSVAVVRESGLLADRRYTLIEQTNQGAHHALNRAISLAESCQWVAILNSDDCFDRQRIAECEAFLKDQPHVQLLCSGLRLIGNDGAPLPESEPRARWFRAAWSLLCEDKPLAATLGVANFPATTSNFFARKTWLLANPFRPYRYAHDYFALVTAALADKLAVLQKPLLSYRVHPSNTITTAPEHLMRELLIVNLDLIAQFASSQDLSPAIRGRFAAYRQALWYNISGVRADLLDLLLSQGALANPKAAVDALRLEDYPELAEFPNKPLVNLWDEATPLLHAEGVVRRLNEQRRELKTRREREKASMEMALLLSKLARSRWANFGRLLGFTKPPRLKASLDSRSQLEVLRNWLEKSFWFRLGTMLGLWRR
ncbi:MAG: glycosyltransferase family 2 protein [Verrucomicrobiia bacterium]